MTFLRRFLRTSATIGSASSTMTGWCMPPSWTSIGSRSAISKFPVVLSGGGSGAEAASESADQLDVEGEGAGLELRDIEPRFDDAFLGGEHIEVRGQAVLVALTGEAVGLFKIGERTARV